MKGEKDILWFKSTNLFDLVVSSLLMMNNPYLSTTAHSLCQQTIRFVLLKGYLGNKSL